MESGQARKRSNFNSDYKNSFWALIFSSTLSYFSLMSFSFLLGSSMKTQDVGLFVLQAPPIASLEGTKM